MKKTVASLPQAGAMMFAFALAGCGGGGSDSGGSNPPPPPPAPQTAQGVFKDSNVSGLGYTSGGQTGVTNASGGFTYEVGQQVTFRVGNVSLGATAGKALITPVDLVANGTGTTVEVENRVRFLMMLDDDGNPLNGINIVEAVRTRAQQWTQVDFAAADLAAALATIRADVQSATGGTHTLPDAAIARAHLAATFRCAYSGGFRGTYAGDDAGRWGMLVFPNGNVFGIGYSITEDEGFTTGALSTAVAVDQNRAFISGNTTTGASFSGRFTSPDAVSGNWQFAGTTDDGTFTGTRLGGLANALYRFSGAFVEQGGGDAGLFTFDVSDTDTVSGFAYSIPGDELVNLTGTVSGTTLTGQSTPAGITFTATLNKATGQLTGGTYQGDLPGSFSGAGCRLN